VLTLPAGTGTYVLVLRSAGSRVIRIGCLGRLHLHPGYYGYVGSAFGPGGLRARVEHHTHHAVQPRWHIDYLRRHTRLEEVWYCRLRCEHECASALAAQPGVAVAMPGFGSSDCRCRAHLFWFGERPLLPECLRGFRPAVVH